MSLQMLAVCETWTCGSFQCHWAACNNQTCKISATKTKSIFYSPRSVAEVHIEVLWDIVTNFAMTSGLCHELSDFCKGIIKLCGISLEKQEMKRDKLIKKNKKQTLNKELKVFIFRLHYKVILL